MAIKNSEELSQDIENQLLNREVVDDIQDALKKEKATIADAAAEQVEDELLDPAALAIRLEAAKRAARSAASEAGGVIPDVQALAQQKADSAQGPLQSNGPENDSEMLVDEEVESAESPDEDAPQEEQQAPAEQPKEQAQPESAASAPQQSAPQKSAVPQSQQAPSPAQKEQPSSDQPESTNTEDNTEQEADQEPEDDVPDAEEENDDGENEDEKEEEADTNEDGEVSDENTETESSESSKKSSSEIAPEDEASAAGDLNKEKAAARTAGEGEGLLGGEAGGSMGGMPDVGTLMNAASGGREGMKNAAMNAVKTKVAEEAGAAIGSALMPGAGTALGALAGKWAVNTPIVKWLLITLLLLICIFIVTCVVFFFFSLYAICNGFITGTLLTLGGFDCSWADSWLPGI